MHHRPPSIILCVALASGLACSGGNAGTAPEPPFVPAVTTVEVTPVSPAMTQWDSLTLTATVKDQRGGTMSGKTVTWASSAEAVATVSASGVVAALTPGTATITATVEGKSGSTPVTVAAAVPQAPLRLAVEPGSLLLPAVGAAAPLHAVIVDARGRRFPVAATYALSRSGVVTVSAAGVVAAVANGSVQVTATAQGLTASAVLVLVTTPAPTVTLVPDSAVVGGITPVSTTGPVRVGWRYRVRLKGAAPAVGARLVGSGSAPIAGQVVSVVPEAGTQVVTLEVRPLSELLPELTMTERLPLSPASAVLNPALRSGYRLETSATAIRLVPTGSSVLWPGPVPTTLAGRWSARAAAFDSTKFSLGPLECEAKVTILPRFSLPWPDVTFTPGLNLDLAVEAGRLSLVALNGTLQTSLTLKPRLDNTYSGEVSCTKPDFVKLRVPIAGPMSLLVGSFVPLGAGFDLTGGLTVAQFGLDLTLSARPTLQLGLACGTASCSPVTTYAGNPEMQVKWVLPDLGSQFRVNVEAWAYGMTGLEFGSGVNDPWDLVGDFSLLKARLGASQTADWAPMMVQAADAEYASTYRLSLKAELGLGDSADSLVTVVRQLLSLPAFLQVTKKELSATLARSPWGRITAAPASVRPGDSVSYLVNLDTTTYLGSYGLDSLVLQRRRTTSAGVVTLDTLAGPCNRIPVSVGQELFQCKAAFADTGAAEVHAFLRPRVYGISMPTWLELSEDARASTSVSAVDFDLVQIAAGGGHTCGLTRSGKAYCWGSNVNGQIGDATTSPYASPRRTPTPVAGGLTLTTLMAGNSHSCGLTRAGAAYCWGDNSSGQLGDSTTTSRATPVAVRTTSSAPSFTSLAQGGGGGPHTCGIVAASAAGACWGGSSGVLGVAGVSSSLMPLRIPEFAFSMLATNDFNTCGVTAPFGYAYCWGDNTTGQLGTGTHESSPVPVKVGPEDGISLRTIAVGGEHTCGITVAGVTYCWGDNYQGQVGDGTTIERRLPTPVAGGLAFVRIVAGDSHVCALTASGAAYCWGSAGRIGDGTLTKRLVPTLVSGGLSFVSLAAGNNHTCGVTADGAAYCWGQNGSAQLGDGTITETRLTPVRVKPPAS